MADLISRHGAIIATCANCAAMVCKYLITDNPDDACVYVQRIYKLPSVTTCKECTYYMPECGICNAWGASPDDEDSWCSCAIRKKEAEN